MVKLFSVYNPKEGMRNEEGDTGDSTAPIQPLSGVLHKSRCGSLVTLV